MAVEITMPKMGLSMVTGTIVKWLKNEGSLMLFQLRNCTKDT